MNNVTSLVRNVEGLPWAAVSCGGGIKGDRHNDITAETKSALTVPVRS